MAHGESKDSSAQYVQDVPRSPLKKSISRNCKYENRNQPKYRLELVSEIGFGAECCTRERIKAMLPTNWLSNGMKEYPFWRDDMSVEEFEIEREYYMKNFENLVQEGLYLPLWKQNTLK